MEYKKRIHNPNSTAMPSNKTILLGAHMSIAGGIENAYYSGASIGCTAIQFFTHSNRQWAIKALTQETAVKVQQAQKETGIDHAVVHASYLINLASTSSETLRKSKTMLQMELQHCATLGIKSLILHPGSNPSAADGIHLIADALDEIFEQDSSQVTILLENMAGQGSSVGHDLEHLALLKQKIRHKKRIGFCIDTCHLWAAGYNFSDEASYRQVWHSIDTLLGIGEIKALHLNDSKQKCGSRVDRHANIGEGTIGIEAFKLLMNDLQLASIPKILETPGKELPEYERNMKILLDLVR